MKKSGLILLSWLFLYGSSWTLQAADPHSQQTKKPVLAVDTSLREETRNFYNGVYRAASLSVADWKGDISNCEAGTSSPTYQADTLLRVNYFRAMVGIPAQVIFTDDYSSRAQEAALMMSANKQLDHHPTESWFCYTATGADAASNSNLVLGSSGPLAVDNLMYDSGDNNAAVGHRRWILFPNTQEMGVGNVEPGTLSDYPPTQVLWVIDAAAWDRPRPSTRDAFISWPSRGFIPRPLVPERWSFSYPEADFRAATVSVQSGGNAVPTTLEPVANGYGDNTLVWITDLATLNTSEDTHYTVTVDNVRLKGEPTRFEYEVIAFDPAQTGKDSILPDIRKGPIQLGAGRTAQFTLRAVPKATGYQWRAIRTEAYSSVNNAETGLGDLQGLPEPAYPLISTEIAASGHAAYHLAQTDKNTQFLSLNAAFVPAAKSKLQFASRLGWATSEQAADVEITSDEGYTWKMLYHQVGTGNSGELAFSHKTVDLSAYANRLVRLRFHYGSEKRFYPQTDAGVGWYIDDIRLNKVAKVVEVPSVQTIKAPRFAFTPTLAGSYFLTARAVILGQYPLEWSRLRAFKVVGQ